MILLSNIYDTLRPTLCSLSILAGMMQFVWPVAADETELVIHAVNYPPYEIENPGEDGLHGFDVEVVVEAFKRVDLSARVVFLPWNRVLSMAERGTTVAALSCAKAESRDHYFHYSDPISSSTNVYVARKDFKGRIPLILADGKNHKVVVVGGYINELELKEAGIPYLTATNDKAALNILFKRKFDFFYSTREFIQHIAVGLKISDKLQYFNTNHQVDYHLCFSRAWPNSEVLHEKFNNGLAQIKADGTLEAIHAQYQ
ncbi:substrate-binding periplasmic protein [Kiloniella antarctica]|uniref:Substrate-binding periplasmic protein n=1 Tax=Kiloniella antarctica TaxID=1550907 RepID=A0ABW5BL61_9PROT